MARKIGALWVKEKDGKRYFTGVLEDLSGNIPIVIFKNDRKEKDNQPDYQILLSDRKKENDMVSQAKDVFGEDTGEPSGEYHDPNEEIKLEDIPF